MTTCRPGTKWTRRKGQWQWDAWDVQDGVVQGTPLVFLNPSETDLLTRLMAAKGRPVPYESLMKILAPGKPRELAMFTVRANVMSLRKKIGADNIVTVKRAAYRLLARTSSVPGIDDAISKTTAVLVALKNLKKQLEG